MMQATPAPPLPPGARTSVRWAHTVELLVFLFLLVPALALSLVGGDGGGAAPSFPFVAVATVLRDLAMVSLVLFFLWRDGEPVVRIGWTGRSLAREAWLGLGLFVPIAVAVAAAEIGLRHLGLSAPSHAPSDLTPQGAAQTALAVALVVVVAVSEETLFRGYLLLRLREATRSTPLAVLLSSGLFGLGHGYEGAAGMASVGLLGLLLALVALWRGSLVAPIVVHFCQDFLAIVIAPHLAHAS